MSAGTAASLSAAAGPTRARGRLATNLTTTSSSAATSLPIPPPPPTTTTTTTKHTGHGGGSAAAGEMEDHSGCTKIPGRPHTHDHSHSAAGATATAAAASVGPSFPDNLRLAPPPPWQSFLFSSVAATVAAPFTNPFAVAKTQLQVQRGSGPERKYRGMMDFFRKAAASEGGWATLQRGAVPVMMREASKNLFRIGLYQPVLGRIHPPEEGPAPVYKRMIAGAVSGAVGAVACNPFEIVRIRVQAQTLEVGADGRPAASGPGKISSDILRNEGLRGFYRAGGASVMLGMVCTSVNLTTYTLFHETAVHRFGLDDGPAADTTCALASGFLAALAMNPVDVTRTRLMTQPSPPIYRNGFHAFGQIFAHEGPRAFLKGFMPSFLRVGPHFVLTFLLLEQMRRAAKSYNADRARDRYFSAAFRAIDADGSGEISREELFDALLEADPDRNTERAREETDDIFVLADRDGNGEIDLDEFLGAAREENLDKLLRGQHLLAAFRSFDTDGNGTIDERELLEALRNIREGPGDNASRKRAEEYERGLKVDVRKIMKEVDDDGDGTIDFKEFARAYDKMGELEEHRLFEAAVLNAGVALGE